MANEKKICGFCGRPSAEVTRLSVHGNLIDFCDECLDLCCDISEIYAQSLATAEDAEAAEDMGVIALPAPKSIKEELDKHVIGQEDAKKVLGEGFLNNI